MSNRYHILIVDDDANARSLLRDYLLENGFAVSEAGEGIEMRQILSREVIDLVLLDIMMPGDDGLTLAKNIRRESSIPIIMVTGRGEAVDRAVGLESGVDDYIAKPFFLREVLARIRTVLRRTGSSPAAAAAVIESAGGGLLGFAGWQLDLRQRKLRRPDGAFVGLTTREFDLLCAFARAPNRTLTRDDLTRLVKGRDWAAYERTIDNQVVHLRRKIEVDPSNPELIKTVHGAGYVFTPIVDLSQEEPEPSYAEILSRGGQAAATLPKKAV